MKFASSFLTAAAGWFSSTGALAGVPPLPSQMQLDQKVAEAMKATGARSIAVAVIDRGRVVSVTPYGVRNVRGAPLERNSILYGASLTKAVFAYLVLQLADEGKLNLDTPLAQYLPKPPEAYTDADAVRRYGNFTDVFADPRWRRITARTALNHATGLVNISSDEPEGRLRLHFEPGSRYAYSGMGLLLLQLIIEKGLGLNVAEEAQRRVFGPLNMTDTAFTWRDDFAGREATGWSLDGEAPGHAHQSRVRVAGSMDTSIADMANFAAALVRGAGLSSQSRRELSRQQLAITTESQFPTMQPESPPAKRHKGLAVGSGVITFNGPQGRGFMKGGHNDLTGNTMVCLVRPQRCIVILGPDVRAEAAFPELVRFVLGDTGFPWHWEYGNMRFWQRH